MCGLGYGYHLGESCLVTSLEVCSFALLGLVRRYNWKYRDGLQSGSHHGLCGVFSASSSEGIQTRPGYSDDAAAVQRNNVQLMDCMLYTVLVI